jgi:hypothetical protein
MGTKHSLCSGAAVAMAKKITLQNTEQYQWGERGIGWFLKKADDITIVEERIAPGVKEVRHYHEVAWQFFISLRVVR